MKAPFLCYKFKAVIENQGFNISTKAHFNHLYYTIYLFTFYFLYHRMKKIFYFGVCNFLAEKKVFFCANSV